MKTNYQTKIVDVWGIVLTRKIEVLDRIAVVFLGGSDQVPDGLHLYFELVHVEVGHDLGHRVDPFLF